MLNSFFGFFALGIIRPDRAFANINLCTFCRNSLGVQSIIIIIIIIIIIMNCYFLLISAVYNLAAGDHPDT